MRTKSSCAITFSVTCCTITGINAEACAWLRVCSRRATSFQCQRRSSSGRNARCTMGRLAGGPDDPIECAATVSTTAAARFSASMARPSTAPGSSAATPGSGSVVPSPGSGTFANTLPAALPASPMAPRPRRALRRSTSVTPGGGAGTGMARGQTSVPGLRSRSASSVPAATARL